MYGCHFECDCSGTGYKGVECELFADGCYDDIDAHKSPEYWNLEKDHHGFGKKIDFGYWQCDRSAAHPSDWFCELKPVDYLVNWPGRDNNKGIEYGGQYQLDCEGLARCRGGNWEFDEPAACAVEQVCSGEPQETALLNHPVQAESDKPKWFCNPTNDKCYWRQVYTFHMHYGTQMKILSADDCFGEAVCQNGVWNVTSQPECKLRWGGYSGHSNGYSSGWTGEMTGMFACENELRWNIDAVRNVNQYGIGTDSHIYEPAYIKDVAEWVCDGNSTCTLSPTTWNWHGSAQSHLACSGTATCVDGEWHGQEYATCEVTHVFCDGTSPAAVADLIGHWECSPDNSECRYFADVASQSWNYHSDLIYHIPPSAYWIEDENYTKDMCSGHAICTDGKWQVVEEPACTACAKAGPIITEPTDSFSVITNLGKFNIPNINKYSDRKALFMPGYERWGKDMYNGTELTSILAALWKPAKNGIWNAYHNEDVTWLAWLGDVTWKDIVCQKKMDISCENGRWVNADNSGTNNLFCCPKDACAEVGNEACAAIGKTCKNSGKAKGDACIERYDKGYFYECE